MSSDSSPLSSPGSSPPASALTPPSSAGGSDANAKAGRVSGNVTVTTRRLLVQRAARTTAPAPTPVPAPPPSGPAKPRRPAAAASTGTRKRRSPSPAPEAGPSKAPRLGHGASKKPRGGAGTRGRAVPRENALLPPPEPVYRAASARSRSGSSFGELIAIEPIPRAISMSAGFTPYPDVFTSEKVIQRLMKSYEPYFENPRDPNDKSFEIHEGGKVYPSIWLEYPNNGCEERYALLAPKDKDHYNPIYCLEKTLHVIVKEYLSPEQQAAFGYVPDDLYLEDTCARSRLPGVDSDGEDDAPPLRSRASSASPPPRSRYSSKPSSHVSDSSSLSSLSSVPSENLLRTLRRAIIKRDGPLFMEKMEEINRLLFDFKYKVKSPLADGAEDDALSSPEPAPQTALASAAEAWDGVGLPQSVLERVVEETYQRAVGPDVPSLRRYEAFSSEVYGELTPRFVSELVRVGGLGPGKLFVDLGAGVANVVCQAALESGCAAFGVEVNAAPARVAAEHARQFEIRAKMWGLTHGAIELEQGDMLNSRRVDELLPQADVVLVNNKVFTEDLNQQLRPKFLDLKEGAILISLKPFVAPNARLTARNIDDMSAIFDVSERRYHSGHVSWGSSGGHYYIHRVDRTGYAQDRARFERTHPRRAAPVQYKRSHYDD